MLCESDVVREFFRKLRVKLEHKDILSDLNDPRKTMRLYREIETIEEGIANHYELNFERRTTFFITIMCIIYGESSIRDPHDFDPVFALIVSVGVVFFIINTEIEETFVDNIFEEHKRDMSIQSYFKRKVLDGMLGKSFFKHKPNLDGVEANYKSGQLM